MHAGRDADAAARREVGAVSLQTISLEHGSRADAGFQRDALACVPGLDVVL